MPSVSLSTCMLLHVKDRSGQQASMLFDHNYKTGLQRGLHLQATAAPCPVSFTEQWQQ